MGILKVNDEKSRIRIQDSDPLVRGMDPRIRIYSKMSWIRNTAPLDCLTVEHHLMFLCIKNHHPIILMLRWPPPPPPRAGWCGGHWRGAAHLGQGEGHGRSHRDQPWQGQAGVLRVCPGQGRVGDGFCQKGTVPRQGVTRSCRLS